ncbi:MAG: NAD(P)H-binding protein [Solirubrobacteraceae bacterium]
MIVITTPTGQIGRQVLGNLLDSGEQLRVIARDPSKLPAGVRKDLDIVEGSHGDAAVVDKAFAGADAVLWLTTRSFDHGMPSGLSQAQQRAHDIEEPAVEPANDAGEQEGCGRRHTGRPGSTPRPQNNPSGRCPDSHANDRVAAHNESGYLRCPKQGRISQR